MSDKSNLVAKLSAMSPKAKQYAVLGIFGTVFMGLVFGSVVLWDNQPGMLPPSTNDSVPTNNIATPGVQVDPRDVWMAESSQEMKEMNQVLLDLKQKINEVEQKQAIPQQPQSAPGASILPPLPPLNPAPQPEELPPPPPVPAHTVSDLPPLPPIEPREPGISVFEVSDASSGEAQPAQPTDPQPQAGKTYIPSGAFMRVALLGGLDAPTGGQAQNDPHPVLLRVQDNAFLPNRFRAKVKECFFLASGHGDISSERVKFRLESFSCVLKNGDVVDTTAKGYIVGEDGKAGMRGRLISKQGQVLANALMTGIISGIGRGFQQSATTYSTTALGSVGTVDHGKNFQAGMGEGIGKALDRLSQYYITLAEKMFPVLEVDAGREGDVVLTKGLTLGLSADAGDDEYSSVWKRGRRLMGKTLNELE